MTTNPRKDTALSLMIPMIALLLMLPFRSISLDDFDSYSFALALEDYNLALQHPQPPGFPVYIAAASAIHTLRPNPVFALTLLSALCGAAAVWLLYQIGRGLNPQHPTAAVIAALLFAVLPVSWLTSGKALSDMPGMFAMLLSLWLWLRWRSQHTAAPPYVAAVVTGLSLGVRPQNALPVALLVCTYLVQDIAGRRQRGSKHRAISCRRACWLRATGAGIIGVLVWLIPTAALSGGLGPYLSLIGAHASHVGRADALLGMDAPLLQALRIRLIAFADTGLLALTGVGLHPPHPPGSAARHLIWALLIAAGLVRADWRRRQTQCLGIWWLVTALQVLIFETLDRPRLLLPLAPPLVLLVATGWAPATARATARPQSGRRTVSALVLCGGFLALLLSTLPLVAQLSQTPAPPAQATAYIRAHYPPESTLVAAAGSFRAAQVALDSYPLVYLYIFDPQAVATMLTRGVANVALLDRDQFTPEAVATLSQGGALVTLEDRLFTRDRRVHTQHDQVRLQVLTSPDRVPTMALRLPESGCLDLGGPDDGRYLGEGWFRTEDVGGATARWAGGEMTSTLRLALTPTPGQSLRLRALAYPPEQAVTVMLNGEVLGSADLDDTWTEVTLELPQQLVEEGTTVTVALAHRALASPFEVSEGTSSDRRALTAAYDWLCTTPTEPRSPTGDE